MKLGFRSGNKAMQSKQYSDAIELYNCAIALYEKSAVYYCNRYSSGLYCFSNILYCFSVARPIKFEEAFGRAYIELIWAYGSSSWLT